MTHVRRKITAIIIAVIIMNMVAFSANCKVSDADDRLYGIGNVVFFDVGDGDATFVKFPDGKSMLIDCGANNETVYSALSEFLKKNTGGIDYFVLSHPDENHMGNAKKIIEDFTVREIFAFKGISEGYSAVSDEFFAAVKEKGIPEIYSEMGVQFSGEDYFMAFLSPEPYGYDKSVYNDLILSPNDLQNIKDISPVIYYECAGVRFIITGDAGEKAERHIVENYTVGIYGLYYNDRVNLSHVDFLKVADHGSENASSKNFINCVSPDNAVISCGGRKNPSKAILSRLSYANPEVNVLRTDMKGTVTVSVMSNGNYIIKTELF